MQKENQKSHVSNNIRENQLDTKFMVTVWNEVFDWLSLKDLHSIAQTCQRMQRIAGWIFREKYPLAFVQYHEKMKFLSIKTGKNVNIFREHIQKLSLVDEFTLIDCRYIGLNRKKQFKSLMCIDFEYITLYPTVLHAIKDNFVQIQEIKLKHCTMIDGDLYECLLKQAEKLKVLRVEVCFESNMMIGIGNDWLCYKYPELQHLDLRGVNGMQCNKSMN